MLRQTLLAAAAVGAMMAAAPGAAEAVVTYALVDQVYGFSGNTPPTREQRTGISFTVSDAAVARGSFQLTFSSPGLGGDVFAGNVADLVNIVTLDQVIAPGGPFVAGSSSLNVTFDAGGSVNALALSYAGRTERLFLSSAGAGLVTGTYGSDSNNCGIQQTQCTVSGRIATVPEPMSLALLGMGLLGTFALARRQF